MYKASEAPARRHGRITRLFAWGGGSVLVLAALALIDVSPSAAAAVKPTVPAGFTISKVADIPAPAGNCDDIGLLAGNIFVACQDKTLSSGAGGNSTLVEFTPSGSIVNTWSINHKIDGMSGDPL